MESKNNIKIKSPKEIELLRQAGKILSSIVEDVTCSLKAGMTTQEVNDIAERRMEQHHVKGNEDYVRTWEDVLLGILLCPGGRAWWEEAQYLYFPPLVSRFNARLKASADLPPSWIKGLSFWATEDADFAKDGTDKLT